MSAAWPTLPKGETPDDLRWYARHEALARHSISDVLDWLADLLETAPPPPAIAAAWEAGWNAKATGQSWDSVPHFKGAER